MGMTKLARLDNRTNNFF